MGPLDPPSWLFGLLKHRHAFLEGVAQPSVVGGLDRQPRGTQDHRTLSQKRGPQQFVLSSLSPLIYSFSHCICKECLGQIRGAILGKASLSLLLLGLSVSWGDRHQPHDNIGAHSIVAVMNSGYYFKKYGEPTLK